MKSWLKADPRPAPPEPEHVDIITFNAAAGKLEEQGLPVPKYVAYVRKNGPKLQSDEWGQALPMSATAQHDLDRMVAVLEEPLARLRDLTVSGLLNPDEVEAVKSVYPEVYQTVTDACLADMIAAGPPFARWAQSVLGVLFLKPATQMYSDAQQADDSGGGSPGSAGPLGMPGALPTPSDRRDPAVRELTRR